MPADQLVADRLERVGQVEGTVLRCDLGEEDAFEDVIADLLRETAEIVALNRIYHLVRFFEHEVRERGERLFPIPRAALRRAQRPHDRDEALELNGRFARAILRR